MIMTIQKYSINLVYHPGKQLVIADALSRVYLPEQSDNLLSKEFEINIKTLGIVVWPSKVELVHARSKKCNDYQELYTPRNVSSKPPF